MRILIIITTALALVLSVFVPREARAERATPQEMELVCQNWLAYMVYQRGGWGGDTHPTIVGVSELTEGDTVLARCFAIAPRGYVAVPILKELPPIKAYSEEYGLDVSERVGFPQLLREVLLARVRLYAKTYGSIDATQPAAGPVLLGRVHRQEWGRFLVGREKFDADLRRGAFDPMRDAGPLLTTSWHQEAPYNNLCPMGDGGRCVVGCVATAAAQIMKYHNWPPNGLGTHTYNWDGDQSCGGNVGGGDLSADFSDTYDWANMPDSCDLGCSPEQNAALAELCYEVGVAFDMDYGRCSSGAWSSLALTALPMYFGYDNSIDNVNHADYSAEAWFDLIKTEINGGRPTMYTFYNIDWGHEIVCDGWRDTGGQNQYHMNYGWGGPYTGWYTIDSLAFSDYPAMPEYMIKNIFPGELSGSLSGTLAPGTYPISGPIHVNSGDSLRLMPGTTFIFDGPYPFRIYGTLLAEATESDSIVFTTCQSGENRWRGLRFEGAGSSGSRLACCLIEKGYATGDLPNNRGGGMYCSNSSPTFTNCTISGNSAGGDGGGVCCESYSAPTFTNCTISSNSAGGGGGVFCTDNSSPSFTTCTFSGNTASNCGGGVNCTDNSSPSFMYCTISGNSADCDGGGVYCWHNSSPSFTTCTLSGNSASGYGGGVSCWEHSSPSFTNSTLSGNSASLYGYGGGGVFCETSSPTFTNCTLSGNSASSHGGGVSCWESSPTLNSTIIAFSTGSGIFFNYSAASQVIYCDIFGNSGGAFGGSVPAGLGQIVTTNANGDLADVYLNIFLDPMFADTAAGDFHLTDFSHCIGAGDANNPPPTDFEGDPRPNPPGSFPDIGIDEYPLGGPAFHMVIWIQAGNAVLKWWSPYGPGTYYVYGATAPYVAGNLLATVSETTTWTDEETANRPLRYFYYVTAQWPGR